MLTNYLKRNLMLAGAAMTFAAVATAGNYVDVTHKYLKEPAYIPGWQGVIGAVADGVGEVWNGAFRLYQVIPEAEAGEYTLTCNASYRCGNNDFSKENMPGNAELHKAFIFLGDTKAPVMGLFEEKDATPHNSTSEASANFTAGKYLNSIKFTHKGGDLVFGIANPGCYYDEWTVFSNFKITGPKGEIAVVNGDFKDGIDAKRAWDCTNAENKVKEPDAQKDGSGGGDYRRCGGSPYKYGQQIELPAGKYRFGMQTFHRYGSEVDANGNYYNHKWPCSNLKEDMTKVEPYGRLNRSPKDWFTANDYEQQSTYDHAYIFMSKNAECPKDLNWSDDFGDLTEGSDVRTRIKDCWEISNGDLSTMPHNNPVRVSGNDAPTKYDDWNDVFPYETSNKVIYRNDSGSEREAAAAFYSEPEKWYHYVEFELTAPAKVWVGMGKNSNTGDGYWHPWAYQTLQMWDENGGAGVSDLVVEDENAPVEYYNLQGIRVANPENGIYIVKQGNKVTKRIIK